MIDGTDLSTVIVTIADVRKAGFCVNGARGWFRTHGIPFADFIRDGLPADELIARGDAMAVTVVERKLEREQGDG